MARKRSDERSGQERRAAPRVNRRTIKPDDDTTELLERREGPTADEQVNPRVDSPSEVVSTWEEEQSGAERREEQGRRQANSGPRGRRKSDESLRQEIREILTADPELEAVDVEVEVEGGAVTLRGAVMDPDARLLAEELVESLAGVQEVHNRLRVEREED
jgi:osmotically-inducible protein OsmY